MESSSSSSFSSPPPVTSEDKSAMCSSADQGAECNADGSSSSSSTLLRTVVISIQAGCMLVVLFLTFVVFRYRKYKAIAGSAWILLELILLGALLLYSMVIVRYFEPAADLCLLDPWLRELGFTCCYGTIILKIYRLLVEFRTRKAHRWVVREKDLLKYWAVMVTCVVVYLASGTVSTLQHSEHWTFWTGESSSGSGGGTQQGANSLSSLATFNQSRHLLFPKSIKGESAGGIRVRGDGTSRHSNATSFLLQKARVLRRESDEDDHATTTAAAAAATIDPIFRIMNGTLTVDNTIHRHLDSWAAHGDDPNAVNNPMINSSGNSQQHPVMQDASVSSGLLQIRFHFSSGAYFSVCRQLWWHYVNTAAEIIFLLSGLYMCSSVRNATSHYGEKLCLFLAILIEFGSSMAYTVLSHITWITHNPDHLFLLEFARSQLATTLVLVIIFGPKVFYICRQSSSNDIKRMEHQTSQLESTAGGDLLEQRVYVPIDSEIFKLGNDGSGIDTVGPSILANGEVDMGNVDLSQMDPEVIREELKRVYTQLHVLKMKTLRKDNPHISKRRGGRKPPHRRFSLQRSRVQRDKSKTNRSVTRRPENIEEVGVEESACGVEVSKDESSVVQVQQQHVQSQQQAIESSTTAEITAEVAPLAMKSTTA